MPLILFILIVILIAQIGFWDTFGAILGAAVMMVLLALVAIGILALGSILALRRLRR